MLQVLGTSGPAVLLLPGGAEAVDGFFPGLVEGLLADPGCRVILYDRPGMMGSDVEGALAEAALAVHATISGLGTGPVVAVGQSLGGAVALLLAAAHPADVAGLVLLDPTPINDPALIAQVAKRARTTATLSRVPLVGRMLLAMLRRGAVRSARRHDMDAASRAAILKMTELDLPRLARAVDGIESVAADFDERRLPRVPAAVLTADRKAGDPVRAAHERIATALGVPLRTWPRAEHAIHLTHPREVLAAVREVVVAVDA